MWSDIKKYIPTIGLIVAFFVGVVIYKSLVAHAISIYFIIIFISVIFLSIAIFFFFDSYEWNKCDKEKINIELFFERNSENNEKIEKIASNKMKEDIEHDIAIALLKDKCDVKKMLADGTLIKYMDSLEISKKDKRRVYNLMKSYEDHSKFIYLKIKYKNGEFRRKKNYSAFFTLISISISISSICFIDGISSLVLYDYWFFLSLVLSSLIVNSIQLDASLHGKKAYIKETYEYLKNLAIESEY